MAGIRVRQGGSKGIENTSATAFTLVQQGTGRVLDLVGPGGTNVFTLDGSGNLIIAGTITTSGGGQGTVTTVSVVTANGVSGSVANPTTTPAITLTLGTITPTSINASSSIAISNVTVPTISSTNTLTNKRVTQRVGTATSSATPTINTDNVDEFGLTAQAVNITSMTTNLTGTPADGDTLIVRITGTGSRAITWGASFASGDVTLPTTTSGTKTLVVALKIVGAVSATVWQCMASTTLGS